MYCNALYPLIVVAGRPNNAMQGTASLARSRVFWYATVLVKRHTRVPASLPLMAGALGGE